MIINDLDFCGTFRCPNKAHSKLVVDPDRVLPFAITRQRLEMVTWWRPQVAAARRIEITQFSACYLDQIGRKALWALAVEHGFGDPVPEVSDHWRYVSSNDTSLKPCIDK